MGDDRSGEFKNPKPNSFERNMLQTAKGGGFLAAGSLFELGSRFVIFFLLARALGVEQYGLYALAISAATFLGSISSLGLGAAMVRYVAIQSRQRDEAGLWGTLQIGIGITTLTSILAGISLYFLAQPIAEQIFHESQLTNLLRLFGFIVPFLSLSDVMTDVARGFKRMDYAALAENGVQFTVRMILIGILFFLKLDVVIASVVFGISDIASTVALIYLLHKGFSFKRPLGKARYDFRKIFSYSMAFWASGILARFRKNIITFFLGALSTVTNVGVFAATSKINVIGRAVHSSLVTSVKPILAELFDQKNLGQLGRLYITATRWTFMSNLPLFLIMVLYPDILLSVFGESFTGGATALVLLACGELMNAATGICGSIIDMTGHNKVKLTNSVILLAVMIATNFFMIPRWGVIGAAAAVMVSTGLINILRVIQVWVLMRLLPYDRTFLKPLMAGAASFISLQLLSLWYPANTVWHLVPHLLLILGVYTGLLWLMGLAPEDQMVILRLTKRAKATFAKSRTMLLTRNAPAKSG